MYKLKKVEYFVRSTLFNSLFQLSILALFVLASPASSSAKDLRKINEKSKVEWKEAIRARAVQLLSEVIELKPSALQLVDLRDRISKVPLGDTPVAYAQTVAETQKIYLHSIVREMPLELAADTLIHEGGHLLGFNECEADELAAYVARFARSSQGITMAIGSKKECPELRKGICGRPLIFERELPPDSVLASTKHQRKQLIKRYTYRLSNVDTHLFFAGYVKDWAYGNACNSEIELNVNEVLKLEYSDFAGKKAFEPLLDYLNLKHKDDRDRLEAQD